LERSDDGHIHLQLNPDFLLNLQLEPERRIVTTVASCCNRFGATKIVSLGAVPNRLKTIRIIREADPATCRILPRFVSAAAAVQIGPVATACSNRWEEAQSELLYAFVSFGRITAGGECSTGGLAARLILEVDRRLPV